ncbi:MAG: T9SS type A sorting domain-containing protein [Flavobacteriales bacterium]|nr:T9SS type A sorting domain-containing protein [Flavobacteriales bacterium]
MKRILNSRAAIILGILTFVGVVNVAFVEEKEATYFHSWEELMNYRNGDGILLPQGSNSLFTGSGRCAGCHGHDPNGTASITAEGQDVNVADDWRATMMANSAKDPFWRAKVSHEVTLNPQHQEALEDKCTSCHAPLGRHAAHYDGVEFYGIADMLQDSLALDGVSCNACHQQDPDGIATTFSGDLSFVVDTIFGPFGNNPDEDPLFVQPMQSFVGYLPMYGEYTLRSEMCGDCHTLITRTVDLDGEFTGGEFVEQATYHEWVNSAYNNEENDGECQSCHLPQINEPIVISANYAFLPGREPFGQHWLVGGNSFMLELMKNNIPELGIWATEENYDKVIERTVNQLQNQSVTLELSELDVDDDTAYYEVMLTNLAGHKFPSGYPARRAFIEFLAVAENGDTLFSSGVLQDDYEVFGQDPVYEPHYDLITQEDQVQIYEMVMGDVNNDVTTVLERAATHLKDNRLVPLGFSADHYNIDTTKVVGGALNDMNFNNEGSEGSGTDRIRYHVAFQGYTGEITITARLWYQSVPPKWNQELFSISTPEIDAFEQMYWETGPSPVLVGEDMVTTLNIGIEEPVLESNPLVYPNPTAGPVTIDVQGQLIRVIEVYDANGKLVLAHQFNEVRPTIALPGPSGVYHIRVKTDKGWHLTKAVKW